MGVAFLVLRPIYEKKFRYLPTSLQVHVTTLYINDHYYMYASALALASCVGNIRAPRVWLVPGAAIQILSGVRVNIILILLHTVRSCNKWDR